MDRGNGLENTTNYRSNGSTVCMASPSVRFPVTIALLVHTRCDGLPVLIMTSLCQHQTPNFPNTLVPLLQNFQKGLHPVFLVYGHILQVYSSRDTNLAKGFANKAKFASLLTGVGAHQRKYLRYKFKRDSVEKRHCARIHYNVGHTYRSFDDDQAW